MYELLQWLRNQSQKKLPAKHEMNQMSVEPNVHLVDYEMFLRIDSHVEHVVVRILRKINDLHPAHLVQSEQKQIHHILLVLSKDM